MANNLIHKNMDNKRMSVDCRKMPSEKNCDVYMSGSKEHLLDAAVDHAVGSHNHTNTPELRTQIEAMLVEEKV